MVKPNIPKLLFLWPLINLLLCIHCNKRARHQLHLGGLGQSWGSQLSWVCQCLKADDHLICLVFCIVRYVLHFVWQIEPAML